MVDTQPNPELEKKYAVVETWMKNLSETSIAKELDRQVLKDVFESMGVERNVPEELRVLLFSQHYPNPSRSTAIKHIWKERKKEFADFCKPLSQSQVVFQESGNVEVSPGMRGFFADLTSLAYTSEEEFSMGDFVARTTARAINGMFREKGSTKFTNRMHIRVKGYNQAGVQYRTGPNKDIVQDEEVPFAPASFPPDFPVKAWEFMKTWKK